MNQLQLHTERLDLTLESIEEVRARLDAMSPGDLELLSQDWLDRVRNATSSDPWVHGFTMTTRDNATVVGQCGFKGPPDADGSVEIAYYVVDAYQGRGFATEAASALFQFAASHDDVRVVRAHTLPEPSASTRVLTKCGFQHIGDFLDPDDGLVWRWEQPVRTATAKPRGD